MSARCVWLFFVGLSCVGAAVEHRGPLWLVGVMGMMWTVGFIAGREAPKMRILEGNK